jgi:hypothetical protein
MKKYLILLTFICGLSGAVWAQGEDPTILISTQGKFSYKTAKGIIQSGLKAGAVFKNSGSVMVPKKSSITLLSQGRFLQVEGEKKSTITALFPDNGGLSSLNFESDFGEYIRSAISMVANPENPKDAWGGITSKKGGGDGWGDITSKKGSGSGWGDITSKKGSGSGWGDITSKKGSGSGWGGRGNTITAIDPLGKVRASSVLFRWSKPAGVQSFELEIKNSADKSLFKATTKDTFLLVVLDPTQFLEGQQYHWLVTGTGTSTIVSNPLTFEMGTEQAKADALQKAQGADLYKQSSKVVQNLMEAVALEQAEWYGEADQAYRNAKKLEPGNTLLKLMHAAFWVRIGLNPVATKAFK